LISLIPANTFPPPVFIQQILFLSLTLESSHLHIRVSKILEMSWQSLQNNNKQKWTKDWVLILISKKPLSPALHLINVLTPSYVHLITRIAYIIHKIPCNKVPNAEFIMVLLSKAFSKSTNASDNSRVLLVLDRYYSCSRVVVAIMTCQ